MEELQAGIFDLGGGTLYDADDDIFIITALHGGDLGGVYKNPLDKARDEEKKAEKNKNWLITKGPEEMAKLLKERETLDNIIGRLNDELVENGQTYRDNYDYAQNVLSAYRPAIKAAKKMHLEPMVKKSIGEQAGQIYTQRLIEHPGLQYKHVDNPFNTLPRIEQRKELNKLLEYLPPSALEGVTIEEIIDEEPVVHINKPGQEEEIKPWGEWLHSLGDKVTTEFKIKGRQKKIISSKPRSRKKNDSFYVKTPIQKKIPEPGPFDKPQSEVHPPQSTIKMIREPSKYRNIFEERDEERIKREKLRKLILKNNKHEQEYTDLKKMHDDQVKYYQYMMTKKQSTKNKKIFREKEQGQLEANNHDLSVFLLKLYALIEKERDEIIKLEKEIQGEDLSGSGLIRSVQELQRRKKLYKRKV